MPNFSLDCIEDWVCGISCWMQAQTKGLDECVNVVRFESMSNKGFQRKCDPKNLKQRASFTETCCYQPTSNLVCWLKGNVVKMQTLSWSRKLSFSQQNRMIKKSLGRFIGKLALCFRFFGSHFLCNPLLFMDRNLSTLPHSSRPFV